MAVKFLTTSATSNPDRTRFKAFLALPWITWRSTTSASCRNVAGNSVERKLPIVMLSRKKEHSRHHSITTDRQIPRKPKRATTDNGKPGSARTKAITFSQNFRRRNPQRNTGYCTTQLFVIVSVTVSNEAVRGKLQKKYARCP